MRKYWIVLFLMPLLAFSITDWVSLKLDNRVSVSFPSNPEERDSGGNPMWIADAGGNARCMALLVDYKKYGMDSAALTAEMEKESALEEFKVAMMSKIEGGKLISENSTTTKGKLTFEFVVDMGKEDSNAYNIMYSKTIFIGAKMYSLSFYEKNNKSQVELRKKFFNSFALN
jgi:hypothetical protein